MFSIIIVYIAYIDIYIYNIDMYSFWASVFPVLYRKLARSDIWTRDLALSMHTLSPLSYPAERWDVLNGQQNQVTTKLESSLADCITQFESHSQLTFYISSTSKLAQSQFRVKSFISRRTTVLDLFFELTINHKCVTKVADIYDFHFELMFSIP